MPKTTPKKISAILTAYNGERYLAEAIESVLSQKHQADEIILIDDGSTDNTGQIAGFYSQVRYVYQVNQGTGAARNTGVKMAAGDYLAFLDHDDLWVPDKLKIQLEILEHRPELDMVFGMVREFYSPETRTVAHPATENRTGLVAGAMLIRRASFARIGFFDTRWALGDFIDWYAKAMDVGLRSHLVPKVLLERRLHESNTGILKKDRRVDYVRVLKAALDRRRKAKQESISQNGDGPNKDSYR